MNQSNEMRINLPSPESFPTLVKMYSPTGHVLKDVCTTACPVCTYSHDDGLVTCAVAVVMLDIQGTQLENLPVSLY